MIVLLFSLMTYTGCPADHYEKVGQNRTENIEKVGSLDSLHICKAYSAAQS